MIISNSTYVGKGIFSYFSCLFTTFKLNLTVPLQMKIAKYFRYSHFWVRLLTFGWQYQKLEVRVCYDLVRTCYLCEVQTKTDQFIQYWDWAIQSKLRLRVSFEHEKYKLSLVHTYYKSKAYMHMLHVPKWKICFNWQHEVSNCNRKFFYNWELELTILRAIK